MKILTSVPAGHTGATIYLLNFPAAHNRPLRDAASVEAGVGPECRRKYGMEERQVAPNWTAARAALEPIGLAGLLGDQDDARAGANAIAHAFAVYLDAERRTALATACTALGYTTLGHRLAEVLAEIRVEQLDGELAVKAPYLEDGARVWHRAGARWDRDSKTWRLGQDRRKQLWSVLSDAVFSKMETTASSTPAELVALPMHGRRPVRLAEIRAMRPDGV